MNVGTAKRVIKNALLSWLIAFVIGYLIGNIVILDINYSPLFWLLITSIPGILGGILSTCIYEQFKKY